ncbi:MAG: hypothetical protein IT368_14070 [Candidatus Hydrogenedentes bacterium]|nr:hypothetical protein [Candidatus Hydrogenedentota bacterium]
MAWRIPLLLVLVAGFCPAARSQAAPPAAGPVPFYDLLKWTPPADTATVRHVRLYSPKLSAFWGKPMHLESMVILPPGFSPEERLPLACFIHGYGNWWTNFLYFQPRLEAALADAHRAYPRMIYAFPNAQIPMGHSEFADSVNMGPWGEAFVDELVPALEAEFGAAAIPSQRFLTGFSSGGWSSLWIQIQYPTFFGGTWSVSPDPVDFRYFTGVNIYTFRNMYETPAGEPVMMKRENCTFTTTLRDFVREEVERFSYGFQFWSFDAVFSPRGPDGRPAFLFDRATGRIDRQVVRSWRDYDIRRFLARHWDELAEVLTGRIHIIVGDCDTYGLDQAVHGLDETLQGKAGEIEILYVPDGTHWLYEGHDDLFPNGLMEHIHRSMATAITPEE